MEVLLPLSDIKVQERFRQDMGDLSDLAQSMEKVGLLQPVVVSQDHVLIAGERRIKAAQSLGWSEVPARIVDLDSVETLHAEHDENECRKPFTISERVAIAEAILAHLRNTPEPGARQEDLAAEKAGMSRSTLYRARKVIAEGTPALVEAMDNGAVTPSSAAAIADLEPDQQDKVVQSIHQGSKPTEALEAVEQSPEAPTLPQESDPGMVDRYGIPIQEHAREAFAGLPGYDEVVDLLKTAAKQLAALGDLPAGGQLQPHLQWVQPSSSRPGKWILPHLENAIKLLKSTRPTITDCPYAYGEQAAQHDDKCSLCHGKRWVGNPAGYQIPATLTATMLAHYGLGEAEQGG